MSSTGILPLLSKSHIFSKQKHFFLKNSFNIKLILSSGYYLPTGRCRTPNTTYSLNLILNIC